MDGPKTSRGLDYSRMGSRLTGKASSLQDASNQYSNHTRCNTGMCSTVVRGTENIAKFKALTTFASIGPSIDHQNRLPTQVNQPLAQKKAISKRINGKVTTDVSKCSGKQLEIADAQPILSVGARKQIKQTPEYGSFYAPTISSTLRLSASIDAKKPIKSCSEGAGTGVKKDNLKKNSSSISKVIPSSCSRSISVPSKRDTVATKLYFEGESSSSRTKRTSALSNRKLLESLNTRLYISSSPKASRTTDKSKINDLSAVVKPVEHSGSETTRGRPSKGKQCLSFHDVIVSQVPATKFSILGASRSSSKSLDNELSNVSVRKNFCRSNAPIKPTSSPVLGSMIALCDPSANTDSYSCNNDERIVKPPMILERFEHHQGQTFERMLRSESNLTLGRINYHDQHREMRMDIDNMSYEDLLELVEKIGSVSTGLTDEVLTKCLKRSDFKRAHSTFGVTDCVEDGNRCSICLEECAVGEEIGALACEHWYHVGCIQQWLKLKNWCPICKSPACANS